MDAADLAIWTSLRLKMLLPVEEAVEPAEIWVWEVLY